MLSKVRKTPLHNANDELADGTLTNVVPRKKASDVGL